MTAFLTNKKAKMLATHCMPDHAHIFVGFKPMILISDFIREIKVESNEFLNDKKWRKKNLAGGRDMVFFSILMHIQTGL